MKHSYVAALAALSFFGCGGKANVATSPATVSKPESPTGTDVLAPAAEILGANGVRFDASDQLYVGSVTGKTLFVLDKETGETLDQLGADRGIGSPDDLVIASDGTIYVANIIQGTIIAIAPTGEEHTVVTLGLGVDGITLRDDATLFVGKDFVGDGLYQVDLTGATQPQTLIAMPGWVNAMQFGQDGALYAPIWSKGYVARIDVASATATPLTPLFEGTPSSVKFDAQGTLYASDGVYGDINVIDPATGDITQVARYGLPIDNFAFDSQNRLFFSSYADGSVHELKADGTFREVKAGGLVAPTGLAVSDDDDESVFIADTNAVHQYDGRHGGQLGGTPVPVSFGSQIAPDLVRADGDQLLVAITNGRSVQVWDRATGSVLQTFAAALPADIIRFQGTILVSNKSAGSVDSIDDSGETPFVSGLVAPVGLAGNDSDLFVSVPSQGQILQIAGGGQPLDAPVPIATGLDSPQGIALKQNGNLVTVEGTSGDVVEIDRTSGAVTVLAPGLSPVSKSLKLHTVAVGHSGRVYVSDPDGRQVYRITP